MTINILPYQIVMILGVVVSLMVFLVGWPRRKATGGYFFLAFILSVMEWLISAIGESFAGAQNTKILWAQIGYIGGVQAYPYLFLFVVSNLQQRKIQLSTVLSLMLVPIVTIIIAWTNSIHGWLWTGFHWSPAGNNILIYQRGYWYWVVVAYLYSMLFAGLIYLLSNLKNSSKAIRQQLLIILAGVSFPIITGTAYVLGVEPVPGLDISSTGLVFTGVFLVWGLLRYQMLELMPIARTTLVEQLQDGVIVLDLRGRIVDSNLATQRMFGWDGSRIIGEKLGDRSPALAELACAPEGENKHELSLPDFEDKTLEVHRSSIFGQNREEVGKLLVIRDVTERKKVEDALRMSESKIRAITDSAQDAILMIDPQGLVSYWNPAAERILGYTRAEATGQNLHDLIVPERYIQASSAAFPEFILTGKGAAMGKTHEVEARRKDNTEIPIQLSLSSLQLNGEWYAVGIISDITERKLADQKLQETIRQLEESIRHANKLAVQAETANIAKSEFLANMSHEIRTPMNGVIGMTGLLMETNLDEEQRRYAEIVHSSGEALLALINDILDFSKIEAGKMELETLDFDLLSMLDDFADTLAVRAHAKGLEFLCAADPNVPALLQGDPGRLRQILTNLVGNAIKFTHLGEVAVRVYALPQSNNEILLRFVIRDTGIGIPPEKTGMLFNKFTQVDASTTRQFGGSGLGLAISKQLAELMGGEIGVQSELGRGSEFWFTARLRLQPEGNLIEKPSLANLSGVRILVVDDNATNREILNVRLASWDMRPTMAADGVAALQALKAGLKEGDPYKIAVLDMQMPGMDGATLGRVIKSDERLSATQLVLLSSLGERGDARRFETIGFSGYLVKPLRHTDLFNVLSTTLAVPEESNQKNAAPAELHPIMTRHSAREILRAYSGGNACILLVEDNITNQQVALGMLAKFGLKVDVAANGQDALNALEHTSYDLVLMDVQMPVMDGFEAARRIREPQSAVLNHGIPIVAMTAHALEGDRERCLDAGMNDYLSKPVKPQALVDVLERWLPGITGSRSAQSEGGSERGEPLVFDRNSLLDRMMGDKSLTETIIATFLADIPVQIQKLKAYLDAGDVIGAGRHAHNIKGASAYIGAEALRAVALKMEKAGQAGDLAGIQERVGEAEVQFERLRAVLESTHP